MDYETMITGACSGDRCAIAHNDDRNRRWMTILACRYLRAMEDAEDIVQDVFIKLHEDKAACKFVDQPESKWRCYLRVAVKNKCLDLLRKRKRRREVQWQDDTQSLEMLVSPTYDEAESIDPAPQIEQLESWVEELSPRHRQVFELRSQGKSSLEVAQAVGISVNKVYVYYSEAKKAIRSISEGKVA